MKIDAFALERYFARYEFSTRYLLSSSDCESMPMADLIKNTDTESRELWEQLRLGYTESSGHPLLREEIARLYDGLEIEQTVVTVPEEGIFLLMHGLLEPGDHVICTYPGYQSLYEIARSIGCEVSRWEPSEDQGWHFDSDQLETLIQPNTKLLVINFPHNPTGHLPSREDFETIINISRDQGIYLLSDEMYRFLEVDEGKRLPAACTVYEKAVSLSGLSKAFGLPGLRIGWLATGDHQILENVVQLKDYTTICSSAPSEILGIMGLRDKVNILAVQHDRVRRNLELLQDFMRTRSEDFAWIPPGGGSICFPRMKRVESTTAFCEKMVASAGIMLVPSSQFKYGDRHIRIGFGRQDFPEVLENFGAYLDHLS